MVPCDRFYGKKKTCVNLCIPILASAQVSNIWNLGKCQRTRQTTDICGPSPSGEFHLWHLINEYIQDIQTERQKEKNIELLQDQVDNSYETR